MKRFIFGIALVVAGLVGLLWTSIYSYHHYLKGKPYSMWMEFEYCPTSILVIQGLCFVALIVAWIIGKFDK